MGDNTTSVERLWAENMGPVDGMYLPPLNSDDLNWPTKIEQLRRMTLLDDDVLLFSYPKTGTNWLWEVMTMLRKGAPEHSVHAKVQLTMEFVTQDVLDKMPSPRTLNTHLPFSMLPVQELKARRLKTVHVYRNPKDTCVSMFHFTKALGKRFPAPNSTFQEFAEYFFFGKKQIFGSYIQYLRQMHQYLQQNADVDCFHVMFEDVKKSPAECVRRVADFMDLAVGGELCREIAEACSFTNMKSRGSSKVAPQYSHSQASQEEMQERKRINTLIFRKGEIGDWKSHFTVALNERVDDLISKETKDLPFTFTFD